MKNVRTMHDAVSSAGKIGEELRTMSGTTMCSGTIEREVSDFSNERYRKQWTNVTGHGYEKR